MITPPLTVTPITRKFVREILTWRYAPPYDVYDLNVAPENVETEIAYFMAPETRFQQIERDGEPIAAFSLGDDGQVPGGDYSAPALDIGMGLRPDLTGQGLGRTLVETVTAYAIQSDNPPALRVTVAAFNARALRVWSGAGFEEASRFNAEHNGLPFVIMVRDLSHSKS